MRGAAPNTSVARAARGIIPARAGSSCLTRCARPPRWDHPRACGEQGSPSALRRMSMGSSPRVRGAVFIPRPLACLAGIIPARAGSRITGLRTCRHRRDHPRACGEQNEFGSLFPCSQGSSPRVRGAEPRDEDGRDDGGIIPARAGSRAPSRGGRRRYRDHPRACGEQV